MSMQKYLNQLENHRLKIEAGPIGSKKGLQNGQLSARERVKQLLDDHSFVEIGAFVKPRNTDYNLTHVDAPADGVITGYGTVDGKLVYVYAQDPDVLGGALGEMHAKKIAHLYELAMTMGAPIVGMLDSVGMRIAEGLDAMEGYGLLLRKMTEASGVIVQISGIFGPCGGSAAMVPSLSDFVLMNENYGQVFLNSANTLDGIGEKDTDIGSAAYHSRITGLVDLVCDTDLELISAMRDLIDLLPANYKEEAAFKPGDDINRLCLDFNDYLEVDYRLDSHLDQLLDDHQLLRLKQDYAKEIVIGLGRLGGQVVGLMASSGQGDKRLSLAGSKKMTEFITMCDGFGIPILTMVDMVGNSATMTEEAALHAQALARLTGAYIKATVPKITLILGDAFGSAYMAMGSKHIGADMVLAWPSAKIAIMDPVSAVRVMYEKDLVENSVAPDEIKEALAKYRVEGNDPYMAASRGYVDDIIEPASSRKRLIAAFEMLFTKYVRDQERKHWTY